MLQSSHYSFAGYRLYYMSHGIAADGFVKSSRQVTKIQTRHKARTLNFSAGCGVIMKIESNESRYLIAV